MAGAAASLLVAAPAVAGEPYVPEPVEFDIAAPGKRAERSDGGQLVSAPVRAPKRFNTVGFNWTGAEAPEITLRVRRTGSEWGPWTEAALEAAEDFRRDSARPRPRIWPPSRGLRRSS